MIFFNGIANNPIHVPKKKKIVEVRLIDTVHIIKKNYISKFMSSVTLICFVSLKCNMQIGKHHIICLES